MKTRIAPFHALSHGDRIVVSYGIVTLEKVRKEEDGRITLYFKEKQPPVTYHSSNWPEVVVDERSEPCLSASPR